MKDRISAMLDLATEAHSRNKLSPEKIQSWLSGYLERYDDEMKRFPETSTEPHFDLLMADFDKCRDALFVVAVFRGDYISFAAGRGESAAVRGFAETDFPENAQDVIPELQKRFKMFGKPVVVAKQELEAWVGQKS